MTAKLALPTRVFYCDHGGLTLDRDVNASINIARQAATLAGQPSPNVEVAGLRPETRNADSRPHKTDQGDLAAAAAPSR